MFESLSKNLVIGLLSLLFVFVMPVFASGHKTGHESVHGNEQEAGGGYAGIYESGLSKPEK